MEADGPCAAPQGNDITDSVSDPLYNFGLVLISMSLVLAINFYNNVLGINNRLVIIIMDKG